MFKSYLKTAVRSIVKHKTFSAINVLGLAIGIAACLLILQYVRFEKSYDNYHALGDRIFRVQQNRYEEGKLSTQWAAGSPGIGPLMKEELPEVEEFAKLIKRPGVITYEEKKFREDKVFSANNNVLTLFSNKFLKGKAEGALTEPNTAVITESIARKYFGNEDPIGKVISRNKEEEYKITAVIADVPYNTHLKYDVLLSFITYVNLTNPDANTGWYWDGFLTYLLLKPGADIKSVEAKMNALAHKQYDPEGKNKNKIIDLNLQPLKDIHLTSNFMGEVEANGDGKAVKLLLIISIFIIIIAWINYINLSTARSMERAKEVGVRKVMGSYRIQLIRQFLFESLVVNFLAIVLAFLIIIATLPLFNTLTGKEVSFTLMSDSKFWLSLVVLFIAGTFLSGLYPAFVLSSFKPIEVLKGKLSKTSHGAWLRQALVIMQFAASIALIIGTYSIYRQLQFMKSQDLGVQVDNTLVLRGPSVTDSTYEKKLTAFKTEMLRHPAIQNVAASSDVPGNKIGWNAGGIRLVGSDPNKSNQYRIFGIDYDFIPTYGLQVLNGRGFDASFGTDTSAVIFNEAAVKLLGFDTPEEALNKRIEFWGNTFTIIGVVSNHHQESLKEAYDAYIYRFAFDANNFYSIKLHSGSADVSSIITLAENKWASHFPGNPFEYFFLDDHFAAQYKADEQFGKTFALFAVLAIIIACLGLFGLASFVTTQRTKEIGIRKISGASITSILFLLTRDFIKPVLIAFIIASPITYYLLKEWLQGYAFQTDITIWMFVLPAMIIMVVAMITISIQTIKAASANPVKSLRTE